MAMDASQDENFSVHFDGVKTNVGKTINQGLKKTSEGKKSITIAVDDDCDVKMNDSTVRKKRVGLGGRKALKDISNLVNLFDQKP